jgi:hypothetical protein
MRKIITVLIVLALPACWQGCESVLDKVPDGQITLEKVLTNYGRSKALIDVVYNEVYNYRDQIIFHFTPFDVLTDNAYKDENVFSCYKWHNGALAISNPVITDDAPGAGRSQWQLWPDFWYGVRLANNAIKYLPQSTVISPQERDRWVAEARVLRCWYYMNLIEFYGPMPWIDFPFEADFAGWNDLVRPTYDEIATQISNELMDVIASGVFPNRQTNQEFHRVSNGLAYAIRARVLLNNASPLNNPGNDLDKWQRAANAAQDVIALPEYEMVPMADYKTLFVSPLPAQEVIWWGGDNGHINNVNGVDVNPYPYSPPTISIPAPDNVGGCPTQELVDCFEMTNGALPVTYNDNTHSNVTVTPGAAAAGYSEADGGNPYANRDARFYIDILYNGANYGVPYNCTGDYIIETFVGGRNGFNDVLSRGSKLTNTGYYNRKDTQIEYWGPGVMGSGGQQPTHWVHFRLAEFYLNKAEALCETGDLPNARIALNIVRERAGQPKIENVPGYNTSQDFLRQRIRNERRVEFCMEGWRFHDQRRWKILSETNRFVTGMRITRTATPGVYHYERKKIRDYESYTDKYLVLPIPIWDAPKLTGMTQPEAWR